LFLFSLTKLQFNLSSFRPLSARVLLPTEPVFAHLKSSLIVVSCRLNPLEQIIRRSSGRVFIARSISSLCFAFVFSSHKHLAVSTFALFGFGRLPSQKHIQFGHQGPFQHFYQGSIPFNHLLDPSDYSSSDSLGLQLTSNTHYCWLDTFAFSTARTASQSPFNRPQFTSFRTTNSITVPFALLLHLCTSVSNTTLSSTPTPPPPDSHSQGLSELRVQPMLSDKSAFFRLSTEQPTK
jgi:hypothetical protein